MAYQFPTIGSRVGGYRVERVIGQGGMGRVYLAEHLHLGRKDAVKVLSPELAEDENFRERFVRESQMAGSLYHPNIIPVFDAGEWEGMLYIAMRYVEGTDLRELMMQEGRLDPTQAIRMLAKVANALDAAHARGLIHRDVKPGNIMIETAQNGAPMDMEHVYLTDFGLVKRMEGGRTSLTRAGTFLGTIDYAAPEQLEGKPLDGRTDVYSLGCVLFECLTGQVPFDRDSDAAVMVAHIMDPPPRPTGVRHDLPPRLDSVMSMALAKKRDDRFLTCGAMIAAAQSVLEEAGAVAKAETAAATVVAGAPPTTDPARAPRPPGPTGTTPVTPAPVAPGHLTPSVPPPTIPGPPQVTPPHGYPIGPTSGPGPVQPPPKKKLPAWIIPAAVVGVIAIVAIILLAGGKHPKPTPTPTVTITSSGGGGAVPAGFRLADRSAEGFTVAVPNNWTDVTVQQPLIKFAARDDGPAASGKFTPNVNVLVQTVPAGTTLKEFTDVNAQSLQNGTAGFTVTTTIQRTPETLPAGTAERFDYQAQTSTGSAPLVQAQHYLVQGTHAFIITFTAAPDQITQYGPIFQQIIDSVRLV
jgi:serine/threonine-protein kinase